MNIHGHTHLAPLLALMASTSLFPQDADLACKTLTRQAEAFYRAGNLERATESTTRAFELAQTATSLDQPQAAQNLSRLAVLAFALSQRAQALACQPPQHRSDSPAEAAHPGSDTFQGHLGLLYLAQTQAGQAEILLQRALALQEQTLGADHPAVGAVLGNLAALYRARHRNAEALTLERRAAAIQF